MQFYEKNNFDALRQQFDAHLQDSKLNEKLQALFTPKPYSLRWAGANVAAQALGYVCNLVSAITAFALFSFVLYLSFSSVFGGVIAWGLSFALSAILCAIIEVLKNYSTNNFLQNVIQFKHFNKALFCTMLACCVVSVGTSFLGAKLLPSTTITAPTQVATQLENVDSLATVLDGTIAATKSELDKTRKENTKLDGSLNSTGRKQIPLLQSQILALETAKPIELDKARERNKSALDGAKNDYKAALEQYDTTNTKNGSLLGWIAFALELIYLGSVLFSWLYYWNCYKERCALQNNENQIVTIPTESVTESVKSEKLPIADSPEVMPKTDGNEPKKRTPIGFFNDGSEPTESVILTGNRICKHCSKGYVYGHAAQKYCSEKCRIDAWELRTGKKMQKV